LIIECDEVWSYVGNKKNKQWIWLAIDRDTGEIVGMAIGDHSYRTAQQLWNSLPGVYGQCAIQIFGKPIRHYVKPKLAIIKSIC